MNPTIQNCENFPQVLALEVAATIPSPAMPAVFRLRKLGDINGR
jgi:hypothetical protein